MTSNLRGRAALGLCAVATLLLLSEGTAGAWSTAPSTQVKPKTYRQYINICRGRPNIPACSQSRYMYKKLGAKKKMNPSKRFTNRLRFNTAMRKARKQRALMSRGKRGQRSFWRRIWSGARSKAKFLHASWFGKGKKNRQAVKRASPFHNNAGFGKNVKRAKIQQRNSWVFKRGRIKTATATQPRKKAPRRPLRKRRN